MCKYWLEKTSNKRQRSRKKKILRKKSLKMKLFTILLALLGKLFKFKFFWSMLSLLTDEFKEWSLTFTKHFCNLFRYFLNKSSLRCVYGDVM